MGYLAHLFHEHGDVEEEEEGPSHEQYLKEIKRVSLLWLSYWRRYPDRSKYGQSTLKKLEQTREEDFNWDVVESWQLRR